MKRLIKNATVSRFVKKAALSAVAATAERAAERPHRRQSKSVE